MSKNFELLQRVGDANQLQGLFASSADVVDTVAAKAQVASVQDTAGRAWHPEIQRLVQQVFLHHSDLPAHAVAFQAVERTTGQESVCARSAEVLALGIAGTVCVIDLDLTEPRLHAYFGLSNDSGVADAVLRGVPLESFSSPTRVKNLSVIPAGHRPVPGALLSQTAIQAAVQGLRRSFDFVLIQAPPVAETGSTGLLAGSVDGTVVVVEASATSRSAARHAVDELRRANAKVLGAVLNNRSFPIPKAIYERLA
ncbi:MAG TPA: CpsD/CapB family tyrosine-protein kinase [Terriglobales bacterium]|nr:CpsD/CapB family tyrosine-protein kinase [Terriglobales bacterium]